MEKAKQGPHGGSAAVFLNTTLCRLLPMPSKEYLAEDRSLTSVGYTRYHGVLKIVKLQATGIELMSRTVNKYLSLV